MVWEFQSLLLSYKPCYVVLFCVNYIQVTFSCNLLFLYNFAQRDDNVEKDRALILLIVITQVHQGSQAFETKSNFAVFLFKTPFCRTLYYVNYSLKLKRRCILFLFLPEECIITLLVQVFESILENLHFKHSHFIFHFSASIL